MKRVQIKTSTSPERYYDFTPTLAEWLARKDRPRVLSFGCSTGDELGVFALLAPNADVLGVDANAEVLDVARARFASKPGYSFALSDWETIRAHGPFDLIMANHVLCRHPESAKIDDLSDLFPFAEYEDAMSRLVECLAPDGVLMSVGGNYLIPDVAACGHLVGVDTPNYPFNGLVSIFDRSSRKIIQMLGEYQAAVREGDDLDPYQAKRHTLFARPEVAAELAPAYALADYTVIEESFPRSDPLRLHRGWKVAPIDVVVALAETGGRRGLLRLYRPWRHGTAYLLGGEFIT